MAKLPPTAVPYFRSVEFTEHSVPEPLLRDHVTKSGVWARITVTSGRVKYQILGQPGLSAVLTPRLAGIVEPGVRHRLEIDGPARFYIEFLRDEIVLPPLRRHQIDGSASAAAC